MGKAWKVNLMHKNGQPKQTGTMGRVPHKQCSLADGWMPRVGWDGQALTFWWSPGKYFIEMSTPTVTFDIVMYCYAPVHTIARPCIMCPLLAQHYSESRRQ
jgi:hypothetical protein